MASQDELSCTAAITENLASILEQASHSALTRANERDAVELLELLPQVFATDAHPARTQALLFDHVQPTPLAVIAGFLLRSLSVSSRLQLAALKALSATASAVLTPDAVPYVGSRFREALMQLHIVPALFEFIESAQPDQTVHDGPGGRVPTDFPESVLATEVLFILCMKTPQLDATLVAELNAVPRLCHVALRHHSAPPTPPSDEKEASGDGTLLAYVAATIRVLADNFPDAFTATDVPLFELFTTIGASQPNRNAVLLIFETVQRVLDSFPSVFLARVVANAAMWSDVTAVCLAHATVADAPRSIAGIVRAGQDVARRLLYIEGTLGPEAATASPPSVSLRHALNNSASWQRAIVASSHDAANIGILRLQRELVVSAVSHDQVAALHDPVMSSFPSLCLLLTPGKSSREVLFEVAIILALACAKLPSVRSAIAGMVRGYEAWAKGLSSAVEHALGKQSKAAGRIPLIDAHHSWLNDPAQMSSASQAGLDLSRVARAVFLEQERRSAAGSPISVLRVDPLDLLRGIDADPDSTPQQQVTLAARAADLTLALLHHAIALALTPGAARAKAKDAWAEFPAVAPGGWGDAAPLQSNVAAQTPDRGSGGASSHMAGLASPASGGIRIRNSPSTAPVLRALGETPTSRPPFRPTSPGAGAGLTPLGKSATSASRQRAASPPSSRKPSVVEQIAMVATSGRAAGATMTGGDSAPRGQASSRRLPIQTTGGIDTADEYLSMALMLHLPITFGVHYNRRSKGAVRTIQGPQGPFVQPVHRNATQSWSASDVHSDDLYVLFLPFHKISAERLEHEVATVERFMHEMKKQLLLTPQTQRSRRWFLHDMMNYVLPKTDLLLREMLGLVQRFGADDVTYQMGVIRLLDESHREKDDVLAVALEESDGAMPLDILRFSSGRLKDVLHSGNLTFAVRRLRQQYFPAEKQSEFDELAKGAHNRNLAPGVAQGVSKVDDIDREIEKLKRRMADDAWGNEGHAEDDDDVESAFEEDANPPLPTIGEPTTAPSHSLKAVLKSAGADPQAQLAGIDPGRYLDSPAANYGGKSSLKSAESQPPGGDSKGKSTGGAATVPIAGRSVLLQQQPTPSSGGRVAAAVAEGPSLDDFDAMYRAVEAAYARA